jgi:putative heme-binding domain-containing protein
MVTAMPRIIFPRKTLSFALAFMAFGCATVHSEPPGPELLETLPDFKVELVRAADPATEGSWISMARDPQGRLLLGAERTQPISRVTIQDGKVVKAEVLPIPLSEAMGMLFAFDSLYINGRGKAPDGHDVFGLFRCRSIHGDDYSQIELLREWQGGGGDHGAHAILLDTDRKHLDIVCGNFVDVPADVLPTSPHRHYADDLALPRAEDSNGFGAGRKPPGGFVVRMEPDGTHCELFASGERNTYCVAFNHDGELFGFDSDMENDWGTPWYRPIRVFHATSGADHGFREGTAKWPEYYADSLPGAVTIGIGCPTGVAFGTGTKFPAKYQRAFFIEDWSYGRLIAVHLSPDGASYGGTWENLLAPKALRANTTKTPLNMTGLAVGEDGALYFTIGGRHTQGGLYRITYTGREPTTPADSHDAKGADARALRHGLEAYHGHEDSRALDFAWPQMGSADRFLRYAARIAVESQPVEEWKARALAETNPQAALSALLALARMGGRDCQADLWKALARFPFAEMKSEARQLDMLRVIEVSLSRQGRPAPEVAAPLIAELSAAYPASSIPLNRELCQVLLALEAPRTIERTLALVAAAPTQEEQLGYIFHLRNVTAGWTPELRREYFSWWARKRDASQHPDDLLRWFPEAGRSYSNGSSYDNFLVKIRRAQMDIIPPPELATYRPVLDAWIEPMPRPRASKKQRAYVQDWKVADLAADLDQVGHGRNFAQGQDAVFACQCLMCHRIGDEGGSVGPELTGIASRFSRRDILESIIEPSKVISEQFANTDFTLKSGELISGRIVGETDEKVVVRPSMLAPDIREIHKADIKARELSKISPMPPGLLNMLSKQEILDLLAYFEAGGRADGAPFKK